MRGEADIAIAHASIARRVATAASVPLLVAALVLGAGSSVLRIGGVLGACAALVVASFVAACFGSSRRLIQPEAEPGAVEIDDDALTLVVGDETTRIARQEIACVVVDGARASIRSVDGTEVEVTMASSALARALANAAGADPGARAVTFSVGRRATAIRRALSRWRMSRATHLATTVVCLGIYEAIKRAFLEVEDLAGSGAGTAIGGAIAAVGSVAWLSLFRRREITVGSDGVAVRGLVGRRFISFASIASVVDVDDGVELTRSGGETLFLPGAVGSADLGACIRASMAARGAAHGTTKLHMLDRGERSVEAWRRDLAKLARKGEGYRDESFASESLASVVEDAAVAPDRRVGAALLLAAGGDEPAKARVRVAASACLDDDLRVALEQAAEGEVADEALEKATRRAV